MAEKEKTYTESYNELQLIVNKMEYGNISIDELQANILQAKELIKICKLRLSKIEVDVNKLISDIEKQ